jgi:hypothetical protein
MNMSEACRVAGVSETGLYYWLKKRPELFVRGASGWTITAENLAKIRIKQKAEPAPVPVPVLQRAAPPPPTAPWQPVVRTVTPPKRRAAPPMPTIRQGERQVGWWCSKCEGWLPMANKYCKCLDGNESGARSEGYKSENWRPLFVRLVATLGGG